MWNIDSGNNCFFVQIGKLAMMQNLPVRQQQTTGGAFSLNEGICIDCLEVPRRADICVHMRLASSLQ